MTDQLMPLVQELDTLIENSRNSLSEAYGLKEAHGLIRAFADRLEGEEMVEKAAVAAANCRRALFNEEPMTLKQLKRDRSWKNWLDEAKAALAVVREMVG